MKPSLHLLAARTLASIFCLAAPLSALAPEPLGTGLVQSIPKETALAHPDLPFAKDVWLEMVRSARGRLDFGEFYVTNAPGSALEPVLRELEKAGERGVKIRFILSSKMLDQDPASVARLKAIKGLEMRIFDMKGVSSGIIHAKYFLVDGREGYVGSQNFDWRALEHIHELGVRTSDPALVSRLQEIFDIDWAFALDKRQPGTASLAAPAGGAEAELVASPSFLSPADVRASLPALVELLGQARSSIRIQLLTYSPVSKGRYWAAVDQALREASVRGVKVQVMVADWMYKSRGLAHLKSLSLLPNVEVRIVSIPEASTGHIPYARTVHSKYLVVDDRILWVGTSNWEEDYFTASRNVELILRKESLALQGRDIFRRLWDSPYAAPIEPLRTYSPRKVD
jgi:phosphatidylserine/phosphatidylglycerophosphate/cardiolipin synthase-like enzyme